jgi:hypothetical protein
MQSGIPNKTTILVFNNLASMRAYTPSGQNRIGIDSEFNNYYIYRGDSWILFREYVPYSIPDMARWPIVFTTGSYAYTGVATQSKHLDESLAYVVKVKSEDSLKFDLYNLTENVTCSLGLPVSFYSVDNTYPNGSSLTMTVSASLL